MEDLFSLLHLLGDKYGYIPQYKEQGFVIEGGDQELLMTSDGNIYQQRFVGQTFSPADVIKVFVDMFGDNKDELVLVIDANPEPNIILDKLEGKIAFLPRGIAEQTSVVKQLIPYAAVTDISGNILAYKRGDESEERLHPFWSIGWGGHVNPVDKKANDVSAEEALDRGLKRELLEELGLDIGNATWKRIGYFVTDESEVSKCHAAAAYHITVLEPKLIEKYGSISNYQWVSPLEIDKLELEQWSSMLGRALVRNLTSEEGVENEEG